MDRPGFRALLNICTFWRQNSTRVYLAHVMHIITKAKKSKKIVGSGVGGGGGGGGYTIYYVIMSKLMLKISKISKKNLTTRSKCQNIIP